MMQISIGLPGAGMSYYATKRIDEMNNKSEQEKKEMIQDCKYVINYIDIFEDRNINVEEAIENIEEEISFYNGLKAFMQSQPKEAKIQELVAPLQETIKLIEQGEIQ